MPLPVADRPVAQQNDPGAGGSGYSGVINRAVSERLGDVAACSTPV
jgi:hypothetical protein